MNNAVLAVAISLDRAHTSVVAAGQDGGSIVVEVCAYRDGTDHAALVAEVAGHRNIRRVVVDPRSPAATLIAGLTARKLTVVEADARDVAIAHGVFVDELRAGRLRYVPHAALTAAVQFAALRPLAGAEAIDRRHTEADASPLEGAQLATWAVLAVQRRPRIHSLGNPQQQGGTNALVPQTRR